MTEFLRVSGAISLLVAIVLTILDLMRYRKAQGIIIGCDSSEDDGGMTYAPRIRFRTENGTDREFQSAMYVHRHPLKNGQPIPVRYHPTLKWLNGVDQILYRFAAVFFFTFVGIVFLRIGFGF